MCTLMGLLPGRNCFELKKRQDESADDSAGSRIGLNALFTLARAASGDPTRRRESVRFDYDAG